MAQIYDLNQYDLQNSNGEGAVSLSEKYRKTKAKLDFRFDISSGD